MAQDRIYIRCAHCREVRGLVRLGVGGTGLGAEALTGIVVGLEEWIEEHARHNPLAAPELGMMEFGDPANWFTLESEGWREGRPFPPT